jgi:hypothetical protein
MPFFNVIQSLLPYLHVLYCTRIDFAVKYTCFMSSRMFTFQSVL